MRQESSSASPATIASRKRQRQRRQPPCRLSPRIPLVKGTATATLLCFLSLVCTSIISVQVSAYVPSPLFPSRTKWMNDGISILSSTGKHNKNKHKSTTSSNQHGRHHAVPPSKWKAGDDGGGDGDGGDLDDAEAGWLAWMVRGGKAPRPKEMEAPVLNPWSRKAWMLWIAGLGKKRTRGAADYVMREAEELGGLPRPDRYSSRYVDMCHMCQCHMCQCICSLQSSSIRYSSSWGQ
jgi:hypothetical protein